MLQAVQKLQQMRIFEWNAPLVSGCSQRSLSAYTLLFGRKQNPNGAFLNWHPNVSCELFTGQ